jgi:TolA-binding protein
MRPISSSQSPPLYLDHDVVREWPRERRRPGAKNDQFKSKRRPIGRRIVRTLTRLFIAILIGVGATLAWRSYGDEAREMVRTWTPSLAWLLPVSATKSPSDDQGSAAATSAELVQQLKPLTLDLAIVRQSLEQLAAKIEQLGLRQEQIVQDIATLQAVEQDIAQKASSSPQARAASPRKPLQPTAQSSSSVPPQPPPSGPPLRLIDGPAQPAR